MQYPSSHHVLMQFWIMSHSFNLQLYQSLIFILFLSSIFISSFFLSNFFQSQFVCSFNHHVFIYDLLGTSAPKICLLTCSLINFSLFLNFPVMYFLVWTFKFLLLSKIVLFSPFLSIYQYFSVKSSLVFMLFPLKNGVFVLVSKMFTETCFLPLIFLWNVY